MVKPAAKRSTRAAQAEAEARDATDRAVAALLPVLAALDELEPVLYVRALDTALRSAVRAVVPGRQKGRNLEPLIAAARKEMLRALRRRARALMATGGSG